MATYKKTGGCEASCFNVLHKSTPPFSHPSRGELALLTILTTRDNIKPKNPNLIQIGIFV